MKKAFGIVCLICCLSLHLMGQSKTNLTGFKGGDFALFSFLSKNTFYPRLIADSVHTEVTVLIEFVVDRRGTIIEKSVSNRIPETELFEDFIFKALLKTESQELWLKGKQRRKIIVPFVFQILSPEKRATIAPKYPLPYKDYMDSLKSGKEAIVAKGLILPIIYIRVFRGKRVE